MAPAHRPLSLILVWGLLSCGGGVQDDPPTELSSTPTVPPQEVLRLAPDECRPFPGTERPDPWADPDTVVLGSGLILEFQGCDSGGADFQTYSYLGPTPAEPYHLVHVVYYELDDWLLLNAETRRWQAVKSRPVFSPEAAWFATALMDEVGMRYPSPSPLDVWAVGPDSVERVLVSDGGQQWGARDPRWVSPSRLEYVRISWGRDAFASPWDTTLTGVTLRDGTWVPDDRRTEVAAPRETSFEYTSRAEADLTGDGVTDTLRLLASGPSPMDVEVSFVIESLGREILREQWKSHEYFRHEPDLAMSGSDDDQYAHVRGHLDRFFEGANFRILPAGATTGDPEGRVDVDQDPVRSISGQLLMIPLLDSLLAAGMDSTRVNVAARRLAYSNERRHPDSQSIWTDMTENDLMTFIMFAGGERTERLAWSQTVGRFFSVWGCC